MLFPDRRRALSLLAACAALTRAEAGPPLEHVLPDDTLAFVSAPAVGPLREWLAQSPQTALWREPAMEAYRDHALSFVDNQLKQPLEASLGFAVADLADMVSGGLTISCQRNGWTGTNDATPGWLLLADVSTATNKLAKRLRFLAKDWSDTGRPFTTNVIQALPFLSWTAKTPAFGFGAPGAGSNAVSETTWLLGQSGSLLVLGTSVRAVEAALVRQADGSTNAAISAAEFQHDLRDAFSKATAYGWVDLESVVQPVVASFARQELPIQPGTIARFLGLTSIRTATLTLRGDTNGTTVDLSLAAPAATRDGLLKFAALRAEESLPPGIVPQTALSASRLRVDLKGALTGLEKFVVDAEPATKGALRLILETAGKDEDPGYDLRSQLLDNLGDDIVVYQPVPATNSVDHLLDPPKVFLVASPAPGRLANALRVLAKTLSPEPDSVTTRTAHGTRIHRWSAEGSQGAPDDGITFAPVPGYVAFCSQAAIVEALVQQGVTNSAPLVELPELRPLEAQVGGDRTGWFACWNDREMMRWRLEGLARIEQGPVDLSWIGHVWNLVQSGDSDATPFDEKLLPSSVHAIARFLDRSAAGGRDTGDALRFRWFTPAPAALAPSPAPTPTPGG